MQRIFIFILFTVLLNSCGFFKYTDQRGLPSSGIERARKNVEEGKGIGIKGLVGKGGTNYEFSTSNPLWRATLDSIDFMPLSTIDYSGGVIISDWYNDQNNSKESLKIIIRFLSNEIQSNSLKIQVFKKNCALDLNCSIQQIKSPITQELAKVIISKAAVIDKEAKSKK